MTGVTQLLIICKYRTHFGGGLSVDPADIETESESEGEGEGVDLW